MIKKPFISLLSLVFLTTACGYIQGEASYPQTRGNQIVRTDDKRQSIFGGDGVDILGSDKNDEQNRTGSSGIGVNAFLWQASLDTLSFMPLASADPFGGVILTDWYSPNGVENERFKIDVFLTGQQLQADALRVSVFKQIKNEQGLWQDTPVTKETSRQLEDSVLAKARELRIERIGE